MVEALLLVAIILALVIALCSVPVRNRARVTSTIYSPMSA